MTNARPHALSFAVTVAISSSIISTQALADSRLQIKSVDISGNGQVEFTQSEVIVQPTLGDDQQPIPKSYTTTYPDQAQVRAGYEVPSEGFTDVLSGIEGGVSSVDQFETDENNVAQKYTKVLKVGDEGVFKFTHNLAEEKLVIEVRKGMTDQNSIEAIRAQSGDVESLEPSTEIANPAQLAGVLKGAHEKAGNLGASDHYVALTTIPVRKVEVNGRSFMRHIVAGNQPPELEHLGQSLFVNDEVLLAAATSAYIQVHVLGKDIQKKALKKLLSYHKPVGYVVLVEDDTQPYPLPEDYPMLKVTEAPGEVIVFRGQKQNSADVAFVEGLYDMWVQESDYSLPSKASAQIKKDKVKSYQYTIRSRQMALLEELAAERNVKSDEDGKMILACEGELRALSHYEYLHQALTIATKDGADEFELTIGQIEVASSVITSTWVHDQLEKHFSFKPAIRNLLTDQFFIENMREVIPDDSDIILAQADTNGDREELASKVTSDTPEQLIEMNTRQKELLTKESELSQPGNQLKLTTEKNSNSEKEMARTLQLRQQTVGKLTQFQQELGRQNKLIQKLQQQVNRIPALEKKASSAKNNALIAQYATMATRLGINDWDDSLSMEEQSRRIIERTNEVFRVYASTGQSHEEAVKANPATIGGKCVIASVNKKNLATLHSIHSQLQQNARLPNALALEKLTAFEGQLGLVTDNRCTPADRRRVIQLHLMHQAAEFFQTHIQNQQKHEEPKKWLQKLLQEIEQIPKLRKLARDARAGALKVCNAQMAIDLGIDQWDDKLPLEEQASIIRQKTLEIRQLAAVTGQSDKKAVQAKASAIGSKRSFVWDNKEDLAALRFIRPSKQQRLQENEELTDGEIRERLAFYEGKLDLVPENEDDLEARNLGLQQRIKQLSLEIHQQNVENQKKLAKRSIWLHFLQEEVDRIPVLRKKTREATAAAIQDYNTQIAAKLGIDNWDDTQSPEEQARLISQKINEIKQPVAATSATATLIAPTSATATPIAPTPIAPTPIAPTSIAPTPVTATPVTATPATATEQPWEEAESELETAHQKLDAMVVQGGDDACGDKIQQPIQEQVRLKAEIEVRKADLERMKDAGKAVENDGDPFQYTSGQVEVLTDEHNFIHQNALKKQALEAAMSLSASAAKKIIALLREGLISRVELENYIKAVIGVDGYQTVAEFEHFLGYKQGIKVPELRKFIQMLSDEVAEQFIGIAITPVTLTATVPAGMKESVAGMKEYAAAVIANYVLDDIAFENGRRTAVFLANVQETLTPYAHAAGLSESELIQAMHDTLLQAHAAAVEQELNNYWIKPSAFLVQAVTWYFSSYKPLLVSHDARRATELSLSNMALLYLLDLTSRGDYLHRMLTPFQHWLERYGVDLDRTGQYAYHSGIEQISEVGGLTMPLGKAASSVILLRTVSTLFARQYNANPHRYRSISRLVPEIVKSMGSGQGVQVPLLHRVTPQKVKTLASATAGLVLGPVATVGAYAHGLISGFTYVQTFGVALASSLTFDFFMNDNKMLTQWLGGPLGRSLDKFNRWRGVGDSDDEYVQRTAIAAPQYFSETDEEYAYRVKANNTMYGWTRHENYLQFRERRDRTMRLFGNGWEQYFRENVPKWSFSHAKSFPYFYTLGAFYEWGDKKATRDEL
ncbi:hypothetical protein [Endozoicomonas sp. 8E]|uniref:hypothetical protein n=1 Tax=Endozoicomonas sp. 8E TaxID=3035692 RepID=UPI0029394B37|nr:hypothetical protein [Endozoicomonas sp. 8E]WOG29548.1 hypothetical protein P6910_07830 [Endozoicomonas sp. 8E]